MLELDFAKVLTSKVVPKDSRNTLVKFENFWCTTFRVTPSTVTYPESVFSVPRLCTFCAQTTTTTRMAFYAQNIARILSLFSCIPKLGIKYKKLSQAS